MNSCCFTLCEKSYHHGAAALINSLIRNGFKGLFVVGFRGDVPPWGRDWRLNSLGDLEFEVEECRLILHQIERPGHLAYEKASFMLQLHYMYPSDAYFYFDPDVYVLSKWQTFTIWVNGGIACCADIKPHLSPMHPVRQLWGVEFTELSTLSDNHQKIPYYMNSGFFGILKGQISFLSELNDVLSHILSLLPDLDRVSLNGAGREHPYFIPDQDAFNIALTRTECPVAWVGPDGMNFEPRGGGFLMSHAVHQVKPWMKKILLSTLAGKRITPADRAFWKYCDGPIPAFSQTKIKWARRKLKVASLIGKVRGDIEMQ